MKNILVNILNSDTSCNKSATRYLPRTHPELWTSIVEATSFLPNTAKPKQRVWHIVNETYSIPRCPITGEEVKWWENRYLTTLNTNARMLLQHKRGDFVNGHSPENNEKRKTGNLLAVKTGRKYRDKSTYTDEQKQKCQATWIAKYGVDNPFKCPAIKQHLLAMRKAQEDAKNIDRTALQIYYNAVKLVTNENWYKEFLRINGEGPCKRNNTVHLDHIYSISEGFKNNIPPYVIGHWTNLRLLPKIENSSKGARCAKTIDELFTDFETWVIG